MCLPIVNATLLQGPQFEPAAPRAVTLQQETKQMRQKCCCCLEKKIFPTTCSAVEKGCVKIKDASRTLPASQLTEDADTKVSATFSSLEELFYKGLVVPGRLDFTII